MDDTQSSIICSLIIIIFFFFLFYFFSTTTITFHIVIAWPAAAAVIYAVLYDSQMSPLPISYIPSLISFQFFFSFFSPFLFFAMLNEQKKNWTGAISFDFALLDPFNPSFFFFFALNGLALSWYWKLTLVRNQRAFQLCLRASLVDNFNQVMSMWLDYCGQNEKKKKITGLKFFNCWVFIFESKKSK